MRDYIEILADFTEKFSYEQLPEAVIEQTKKYIADYYAASFAGFKINRVFNEAVIEVVRGFGGNEQSTVLFEPRKFPVQEAAFVNAIYAHGADMDDGNKKSAGHIGTHVIPAVFSIAEWKKMDWKDVFSAINVGYEFFNRLAEAAQPDLYQKGFHSTGVAGSVACAAAGAKLLALDKDAIYNAVSIAAVQSSGLIIIDESGQGCKPINPGNAARIGVFSALLASHGIKSPRNTFQSHKGWFNAYSDDNNPQMDLHSLGRSFTIMESYLKLYPSCRHTHSCIDAALEIKREIECEKMQDAKDIKSVYIYIYPSAIKSAGKIVHPQNVEEAKFSIPYAVAVALYKGKFDLIDLSVQDTAPEIYELSSRVLLVPDAAMENREEGIRGCRMVVHLNNDKNLEKTVKNPKGEGLSSLDWNDLEKKMVSCSDCLLNVQEAASLIEKCKQIKENDKFQSLFVMVNKKMGDINQMKKSIEKLRGGGITLNGDIRSRFMGGAAA